MESESFSFGNRMCFFQFDGINQTISDLNIEITFENNTAYFAGSALYGGFVNICFITISNDGFDSIFKVQNTNDDPTVILSDPYMVCPCNGDRPHCGSSEQVWHMHMYPGALFHARAVVVGQYCSRCCACCSSEHICCLG